MLLSDSSLFQEISSSQSGNGSGETGPVRPVSTGFLPVYKDFFVEKYIRGFPQASM
jgi:hypothetical protein